MVIFSNPRLDAVIPDYPIGGGRRGDCHFWVEKHPKRGHRFMRQTTGKAKNQTYGSQAAIVDGDDGRTYLLQFAGSFPFINVWRSDFMCAGEEVTGKVSGGIFPEDTRYEELKALILQANVNAA